MHDHHLGDLNSADAAAWAAGSWAAIPTTTLTRSAAQSAERLTAFAEQDTTEIAYPPIGPDSEQELEAFINLTRALFHI